MRCFLLPVDVPALPADRRRREGAEVLEVRVAPEAWPLDAAPGSAPERREDEALATDEAYGLDDAEEEGVDMVGGRILYTTFFLITIHGPTRFICASANAIFLFAAPANKSGVSGSFCKKIGLGYPETPDLFARPIFLRATKKRLDCRAESHQKLLESRILAPTA